MKLYRGNIGSIIDCDKLVHTLNDASVEFNHGHMYLPKDNPFYDESIRQTNLLLSAGYDDHVVEYRHYKSGVDFDAEVALKLSEFLEVTPLMCWASRVDPGRCVPMHWDINPWEHEHKKHGKLQRFFCFISKPEFGHVFVTDTDCYYMEEQGSVYQYPGTKTWHAGSNVGVTPKYLLTLTAYQ